MRRQIRIWIVGVSNARDPRFYSNGEARSFFIFPWGLLPYHRCLAFACRRAMGTQPPMSAPKK